MEQLGVYDGEMLDTGVAVTQDCPWRLGRSHVHCLLPQNKSSHALYFSPKKQRRGKGTVGIR